MKSYATLALFIALTALTSISHAGEKFCMKKYLASLSLHPNASTNFYAQAGKSSKTNSIETNGSAAGRHN